MDTIPILIISLILVILAIVVIVYPLWKQTRPEAIFKVTRAGQTLEEYQTRYNALLASIKDLIFDYEMGKVSAEDYETLLARTKLEAAQIRKEIDRLGQIPDSGQLDAQLDEKIEALVAQVRADSVLQSDDSLLNDVEAEIELLKTLHLETPGDDESTCPNCHHPVHIDDSFCGQCGQALTPAQPKGPVCPKCGHSVQSSDTFCARCGASLEPSLNPSVEDAAA